MKKIRRVIEDVSLNRFIREVVHYARKHPDATFTKPEAGDYERVNDSFTFTIAMNYEEEE